MNIMKSNSLGFYKIVIFILVILTFFMRPFVFGLDSKIALAPFFLLSLLLMTLPQTNNKIGKEIKILSFFYFLFFIGLMISNPSVTILNSVPYIGEIVIGYIICRNYHAMQLYFKYMRNIFIILSLLGIVTFILGFYYDLEKLILVKDVSYSDGEYNFSLFFPVSWGNMLWYIGDFSFVRQYFFFVEPGMVPGFFTGFIYMILISNEKIKRMKISLLVIGIILTFSTGGPLILISSIAIYYYAKNLSHLSLWKILLGIGILAVAYYVFNYNPFFGREAKAGLSDMSSRSVEIHEGVLSSYVMIGSILIWTCGFILGMHKNNRQLSWTIAFLMGLGYLSNYIGFTTLTTLFLLWDQPKGEHQRYKAILRT